MLKPDGARKKEKQKDEIYTDTNKHKNIYSAKKKICTLLYDSIIASLTLMSNVVTTKKKHSISLKQYPWNHRTENLWSRIRSARFSLNSEKRTSWSHAYENQSWNITQIHTCQFLSQIIFFNGLFALEKKTEVKIYMKVLFVSQSLGCSKAYLKIYIQNSK